MSAILALVPKSLTESEELTVDLAEEFLREFVDYFDGTGPVGRRAQTVTRSLPRLRAILRDRSRHAMES